MDHKGQFTVFDAMVQLPADQDFEGMAEAITILVNEAMNGSAPAATPPAHAHDE